MLGTLQSFLTKEKEAQYMVIDVDENGLIVEDKKGNTYTMPKEDITMYQKNKDITDTKYVSRLLGTYITVLVYKNKNDVTISRASYMKKRIQKFQKGGDVVATVVSADAKALYVEFDEGLSGKIYTNQLTSSKVRQPLDIYSIGDNIKCKITKIRDDGYFELSRIELYKGSSLAVKKGEFVKCKITKKLDDNSGYFVELLYNPMYSGIFDINQKNNLKFKVGQVVDLKVLDVDEKRHLKLRAAY